MSRFVWFALTAIGLGACGGGTIGLSRPVVTVTSPTDGATVLSYQPFTFSVKATDHTPLRTITLTMGSVTVQTCTGSGSGSAATALDCSVQLMPTDVAAQVKNGQLSLLAKAVDSKNQNGTRAITVSVKHIRVTFVDPPAMGDPPVAVVKGTSPLTLKVEKDTTVESASVVAQDGTPVATFAPPSYSEMIHWAADFRPGSYTLTATASDSSGSTDSAQLAIQVQCATDGDCNPGQTCCVSSGTCYASSMTTTCQ